MEVGVVLRFQSKGSKFARALAKGLKALRETRREGGVPEAPALLRELATIAPAAQADLKRLEVYGVELTRAESVRTTRDGQATISLVLGSVALDVMRPLVRALAAAGVRDVECDLICDEWEDEWGETWGIRLRVVEGKVRESRFRPFEGEEEEQDR